MRKLFVLLLIIAPLSGQVEFAQVKEKSTKLRDNSMCIKDKEIKKFYIAFNKLDLESQYNLIQDINVEDCENIYKNRTQEQSDASKKRWTATFTFTTVMGFAAYGIHNALGLPDSMCLGDICIPTSGQIAAQMLTIYVSKLGSDELLNLWTTVSDHILGAPEVPKIFTKLKEIKTRAATASWHKQ